MIDRDRRNVEKVNEAVTQDRMDWEENYGLQDIGMENEVME